MAAAAFLTVGQLCPLTFDVCYCTFDALFDCDMFRLSNFLTGFVASGLTLCEIDTVMNVPSGNFDPSGSPIAIAVSALASLISMITLEFFRAWLKKWKQRNVVSDVSTIQDRFQESAEHGKQCPGFSDNSNVYDQHK